MKASMEIIEDFLAHKRVAMVGISRDPANFSVKLFQELIQRGFEVVPVNPDLREVEGCKCFGRVQDIEPPVEAALLMTSPAVTETVVRDCAEAGVRTIWMYRATGKGAVSRKAVEFCQARGIRVIPGECPYMFLPSSGGVHHFHGFIRKITGRYPRRVAAQRGVSAGQPFTAADVATSGPDYLLESSLAAGSSSIHNKVPSMGCTRCDG